MKFMVAFITPKRSARTVEVAAQHAKALNADLVLLRMVPDPEKVGVVAQLIATERPAEKARDQVEMVAAQLREQGIKAEGAVVVGEVASGIVQAATDMNIDLLFVGTTGMIPGKSFPFLMSKDPIVHFLVDKSPISLVLVRGEAEAEAEPE
jgi:nucleotide-binding universal stress UspA family protein